MYELIISTDELKALLKGEYTLLPCIECEKGIVYWDGSTGEVVSESQYHELIENGESADWEICGDCHGIGKIIKYHDEG